MSTKTPLPPQVEDPSGDDAKIKALDDAIKAGALPLDVTLADADLVADLIKQYQALSVAEQGS